jgi:hypothetical protein
MKKKHEYKYPGSPYSIGKIGEVDRILDKDGNDVAATMEGMERLVECANSMQYIHKPENHVPATEEYIRKLLERVKNATNE